MESTSIIPGVNIQWPWSESIIKGKKTVETRGYPLPKKYIGKALALIETPGPYGKKNGVNNARIIGIVTFESCFQYTSKTAWLKDQKRHLVYKNDPKFAFNNTKEKWGWVVKKVIPIRKILPPRKRGIIFASSCKVPVKVDF